MFIELLQPNKTDVLQYLNGETGPPARWAKAVISEGATEDPVIKNYMVSIKPFFES